MTTHPGSRAKTVFLWLFAFAVLGPAAYGFAQKLVHFVIAVRHDLLAGIALVPIVVYLIVTAGMACLLVWAIMHGMFRDVEGPKFDLLEREDLLDADEEMARGRPK